MRLRHHHLKQASIGRTNQRLIAASLTAGALVLTACGGTTETATVATSSVSESVTEADVPAVDDAADSSAAIETETTPADPTNEPAEPTADPAPDDNAVADDAVADAPADEAAAETAATPTEAIAVSPEEAAEIAAANQPKITGGDDWRTSEVLDVTNGAITTLSDVVVGDRPVLVWFWAPH